MPETFHIASLWRYPVKGFQGERLTETNLPKSALLPGDRAWGFTAGHAATTNIASTSWMKKAHFLQLMSFAEAAHISMQFDGASYNATLIHKDQPIISGDLTDINVANAFCKNIETIITAAGYALPGDVALRHLDNGGFSDTETPWISIGGMASVIDFAATTKTEPDVRRFRLNVWIDTKTPFEELGWIGRRAQLGTSVVRFMAPVGRCAAIDVNPDTAMRSNDMPAQMHAYYGHSDLGVFAMVEQPGKAALSDRLILLDD